MAVLKRKGDVAELKVAVDLLDRGCQYTQSDGCKITVRCRSHSLTKGKIRQTKQYTAATVDWIAVYDRTTNCCYYCPSSELGAGRSELTLRVTPARNGQVLGVRNAGDYTNPDLSHLPERVEPAGFEPATFAMQARRSAN